MHSLMLQQVIKSCRERSAQGDCPTTPPFSVEQLEDAVIELAKDRESVAQQPPPRGKHLPRPEGLHESWGDPVQCPVCDSEFVAPAAPQPEAPREPRYDAEIAIQTAHDVRRLTLCEGCGGIGLKQNMVRRNHGRCYAAIYGLDALLSVPSAETTGLTLGDVGPDTMRALLNKA